MLPEVWLGNSRIHDLWKHKFPEQSRASFINLAYSLFKTYDLSKGQLSAMIEVLEQDRAWPKSKPAELDCWAPEDSFGQDWLEKADAVEPPPDWVVETLGLLLSIPNDVSVLDLNCGIGSFCDALPYQAFYEGHDNNPVQVARAKRNFSDYLFKCDDISRMLQEEPDTSYGLVLFDTSYWNVCTKNTPCIELSYKNQNLRPVDVAVELATKCAVRGGVVVIYSHEKVSPETVEWLNKKGTLLCVIELGKHNLLFFRNGIRTRNESGITYSFDNSTELLAWASSQNILARVPVCSEDPRPLVLRDWEIKVKPNQLGFSVSKNTDVTDVALYLSKGSVGIRFKDHLAALEWAQHQALTAPSEETWNKTIDRFGTRLLLDAYLNLREGDLNQLLNLPKTYTVLEESALRKYLNKAKRRLERMSLSYPEKTTLENRYYTLGIGSLLTDGTKTYQVKFSEPDFSNSKPPKVHLERIE